MKTRIILLSVLITAVAITVSCGSNQAPNGSTITLSTNKIAVKDTIDPYIDEYVRVTVLGLNAVPMNGVKVVYDCGLAVGQEGSNNTGVLAILDKNGNICPVPCSDTTDLRGMTTMQVRLCLQTQPGCPFSPLPFTGTTSYLGYGPVDVFVTSGNAAPASIEFDVNTQ